MGYFSNGSEGADYRAQYCDRCVHADGCAIWGAHLAYNYDALHDAGLRTMLDWLIPREADGVFNAECRMFVEARAAAEAR